MPSKITVEKDFGFIDTKPGSAWPYDWIHDYRPII